MKGQLVASASWERLQKLALVIWVPSKLSLFSQFLCLHNLSLVDNTRPLTLSISVLATRRSRSESLFHHRQGDRRIVIVDDHFPCLLDLSSYSSLLSLLHTFPIATDTEFPTSQRSPFSASDVALKHDTSAHQYACHSTPTLCCTKESEKEQGSSLLRRMTHEALERFEHSCSCKKAQNQTSGTCTHC